MVALSDSTINQCFFIPVQETRTETFRPGEYIVQEVIQTKEIMQYQAEITHEKSGVPDFFALL